VRERSKFDVDKNVVIKGTKDCPFINVYKLERKDFINLNLQKSISALGRTGRNLARVQNYRD